ncbi:MAG: hypothetical protein DSM107014_09855 [Gomphosphaeria aponina SAG 52.96 = DSM 107014]|uniref:Uncharacterized protein n=1 Tax=Gomphosphaeria aponina SAG 52.96 = DSM 107014 TaxID=1521640 RepID=A0A941GVP5_9CHRO|nr:hypothetical protein [Gomphosphaeria aponina SAG 52.96 = DSM 107014]
MLLSNNSREQASSNDNGSCSHVNIPSFGICSVTDVPCVPVIPVGWIPDYTTVLIDNVPALNRSFQYMFYLCTL